MTVFPFPIQQITLGLDDEDVAGAEERSFGQLGGDSLAAIQFARIVSEVRAARPAFPCSCATETPLLLGGYYLLPEACNGMPCAGPPDLCVMLLAFYVRMRGDLCTLENVRMHEDYCAVPSLLMRFVHGNLCRPAA